RGRLPAVAAGVLGHRGQHRGGWGPGLPERPPFRRALKAAGSGGKSLLMKSARCAPLNFYATGLPPFTAETEGRHGPIPCTATTANCEFSDGFCLPKGTRPVTISGQP